jgi:hypothetical protein
VQAALSYAAALVPGILGYGRLDSEQQDSLQHMSIARFCFHHSVAGTPPPPRHVSPRRAKL